MDDSAVIARLISLLRLWWQTYGNRRMLTLLALGFSSGLPAPLVFSNLSVWLKDAGVSRSDIGLFALASTPYAINFLWAPLLDRLRLPWLTHKLGRRRSWALLSQTLLLAAILWLGQCDPDISLWTMALVVLFVTTLSATQDVVIDAYRIEVLQPEEYGAGSAVGIWGWHLGGTLVGGAGGLVLASQFGWQMAYMVLAGAMLVGIVAVLLSPEPEVRVSAETLREEAQPVAAIGRWSWLPQRLRSALEWLYVTMLAPLAEFAQRRGWWLILLFIFVFKLGDALQGRMSGVFYRELGFSLEMIAEVSKVYGFTANMVGIAAGGFLAARIGILQALFVSGLAAALTNLTFSWLAATQGSELVFIVAVTSDNFTSGLVTVALVAYLSSLCNSAYTATQYSLLASLANLARIWFSAGSGMMVDAMNGDWSLFFICSTLIALLGLPLLWLIMHKRLVPVAGIGTEPEITSRQTAP